MGRKKKPASETSSDSPKGRKRKHATAHSLEISPLPPPPYHMTPQSLDLISSPIQPRAYQPMTNAFQQLDTATSRFPIQVLREKNFPGTFEHAPWPSTSGIVAESPSVNIAWKGNNLMTPPPTMNDYENGLMQPRAEMILRQIATNFVNCTTQPRTNGIESSRMMQHAAVSSTSERIPSPTQNNFENISMWRQPRTEMIPPPVSTNFVNGSIQPLSNDMELSRMMSPVSLSSQYEPISPPIPNNFEDTSMQPGAESIRYPVSTNFVNGSIQDRTIDIRSSRIMPPATVSSTYAMSPFTVPTNYVNNSVQPRTERVLRPLENHFLNGMMYPREHGIGSPKIPLAAEPSICRTSIIPQSHVPDTDHPGAELRRILSEYPFPGTIPISPSTISASSSPVSDIAEDRILVQESNDVAMNINSLPDKHLLFLFGYFTQNELGRIACVCKKWNELSKSPVLWKNVNVKFYGHHGSQNTVARNFTMRLPPTVTHIRLDFMFCTGWSGPFYFEELCLILRDGCPQLQVLFLKGALLTDNLYTAVDVCTQYLQNLESLTLRSPEFNNFRRLKKSYKENLKLETLNLYACDLKVISIQLSSILPNLKELDLTNTNATDSWIESDPVLFSRLEVLHLGFTSVTSRTLQVIQNSNYLKELYFCGIKLLFDDFNFRCFSSSVLPHLMTICLMYCTNLNCKDVVSLVQSCDVLENVYVDKRVASFYAVHPYVLTNMCKLQIVKSNSCYYHYPRNFYT